MTAPRTIQVQTENNHFQRAEVLKRNREKRFRYGEFLLEGVAQITLAARFGWEFRTFMFAAGRPLSSWATQLLDETPAEDNWELAPELLAKLSDKDEPSELLAIVKMRKLEADAISAKDNGLVLVFDRPNSPGNLGSSIRSADAFGADGIIVTGHAVDIYDPHTVRGSMGALFGLPVATASSHAEIKAWVESARTRGFDYQIIGTSGKAEQLLGDISFERPTVLVFGNETVGISRGYWDISDAVVKIPIGGALSSLNVSCAATVLLYEVARQRAVAR